MMLPTTIFEILEHVEEHRQTPIIGTCIRLIRCASVFLSLYLVPVWMLLSSMDYRQLYQILLVELAIELLRIATIHTPDSISNAMGMIAAVLLGQFAIDLGMFSAEILLYCAIGNVCGFATPNYELSLTNKYLKILMILMTGLLGMIGFIIFQVVLYGYLIYLRPFGFSYLYPLIPFDGKKLLQFLIRKPKQEK